MNDFFQDRDEFLESPEKPSRGRKNTSEDRKAKNSVPTPPRRKNRSIQKENIESEDRLI